MAQKSSETATRGSKVARDKYALTSDRELQQHVEQFAESFSTKEPSTPAAIEKFFRDRDWPVPNEEVINAATAAQSTGRAGEFLTEKTGELIKRCLNAVRKQYTKFDKSPDTRPLIGDIVKFLVTGGKDRFMTSRNVMNYLPKKYTHRGKARTHKTQQGGGRQAKELTPKQKAAQKKKEKLEAKRQKDLATFGWIETKVIKQIWVASALGEKDVSVRFNPKTFQIIKAWTKGGTEPDGNTNGN